MVDQRDDLEWRNGVPISVRFDDPYFSLDDGLAETRHVFLQGNDLPARFADGFQIAELGFGTGLNFLTVWDAWEGWQADQPHHGRLYYTSFEAFPLSADQSRAALEAFPGLAQKADDLADVLEKPGKHDLGGIQLEVIVGDARQTLPDWPGMADAWFLDGFSPAKNPELWEPALLADVGRHTVQGGTAATYSAAGFVRQGLERAGFAVERAPGFGRKRHMTRARKS